jgi:protein-S-isoprenylcysteine O-methyltransferase Ste14
MSIYSWLIVLFWFIFLAYWLISAMGVKKNVHSTNSWWGYSGIVLVVVLLLKFQQSSLQFQLISHTTTVLMLGVILCGLGIAFAVWARRQLGKSWGSRPSTKQEGQEIMTSGPYRLVRHPIYTGMLTALIGSALVGGTLWFIIFVLICALLTWKRVRAEEKFMMQQFPNQYPDYRKRTKTLIPFVF